MRSIHRSKSYAKWPLISEMQPETDAHSGTWVTLHSGRYKTLPKSPEHTCDSDHDNQQVAETADRPVPSSPFDSPSLPPNLPPAIGETAVVLGPARGTTNYFLLSANLRRAPGPCHVTPIRRRRISASPGPIRRSRGKSHFVSSIEEGGAAWESSLAARGTQHM